jgi:hypothetical protein
MHKMTLQIFVSNIRSRLILKIQLTIFVSKIVIPFLLSQFLITDIVFPQVPSCLKKKCSRISRKRRRLCGKISWTRSAPNNRANSIECMPTISGCSDIKKIAYSINQSMCLWLFWQSFLQPKAFFSKFLSHRNIIDVWTRTGCWSSRLFKFITY